MRNSLILFAFILSSCNFSPAAGIYCRTSSEGKECLDLKSDGTLVQFFYQQDTTYEYHGRWELEGARIIISSLQRKPSTKFDKNNEYGMNAVWNFDEITVDEDQDRYNYHKIE